MRNRILMLAAISVIAAALLFLGVALYQLTLPDVVTTITHPAQAAYETYRYSRNDASIRAGVAVVVVGVAAILAAFIASEMER